MTSSDIAAIAFVVFFGLLMLFCFIYAFGTKKARTRYREQNNKKKDLHKAKKVVGETGLKYQASVIKKQYDDVQARRAEEKAERARKFETAKSNLKSDVLSYLDNPSTNSMRYKNDLHALWEKNGFSLTWESQQIQDVSYVKAGIVMPIVTGSELRYVTVTNVLTIEELQYPTEEVMRRQWRE